MSEVKEDLQYTKTHEWLQNNGDGTWTMGITDYAQQQLGDIVYIEFPKDGDIFALSDEVCTIESVKAASGVCAPSDLEVVSINEALEESPETINSDCYDSGYLLRFKADAISDLLDADAYRMLLD